jgi:hypothetical protein
MSQAQAPSPADLFCVVTVALLALVARAWGLVVLLSAFVLLGWFAYLLPSLVWECIQVGGWVVEGWWLVGMLGAAAFMLAYTWACFRIPWRL